MNHCFISLLFLVVLNRQSTAQSTDALVKEITQKSNGIISNLKSFNQKTLDLPGESEEGGQAVGNYDQGILRMIDVNYFGETGKSETQYFFDNGELIYYVEKNHQYNRPIYWDKKTAEENNDSEIFDPEKTIVTEKEKYYFNQGKLIRLTGSNQRKLREH
jgi:hypothetical protein